MHNQDFEAYAQYKPFNNKIADTWDVVARDVLAALSLPIEQASLLDYGCGDAKYYPYFVAQGFKPENIFGLEVSQTRVDRCKAIGWMNVNLLTHNAPLPFNDGKFDLVNFVEVIEHIPEKEGERVVFELRRVIKQGGALLITTPNYPIKRFYDIYDAVFHGKYRRFRDDPTHVTKFNYGHLEKLLKRYFQHVEPKIFKPGFLYKRMPRPFFMHKLFFLCRT